MTTYLLITAAAILLTATACTVGRLHAHNQHTKVLKDCLETLDNCLNND